MKKTLVAILLCAISIAVFSQTNLKTDTIIDLIDLNRKEIQKAKNKSEYSVFKIKETNSRILDFESKTQKSFSEIQNSLADIEKRLMQMSQNVENINKEAVVIKKRNHKLMNLNTTIIIISAIIVIALVSFIFILTRRINSMTDSILYLLEIHSDENKSFIEDINDKIGKKNKKMSKTLLKAIDTQRKKKKKK